MTLTITLKKEPGAMPPQDCRNEGHHVGLELQDRKWLLRGRPELPPPMLPCDLLDSGDGTLGGRPATSWWSAMVG